MTYEPSPSLEAFRERERADPNYFWRLQSGDHLNLLDDAIERLDEAEAKIAAVLRLCEAADGYEPRYRGLIHTAALRPMLTGKAESET